MARANYDRLLQLSEHDFFELYKNNLKAILQSVKRLGGVYYYADDVEALKIKKEQGSIRGVKLYTNDLEEIEESFLNGRILYPFETTNEDGDKIPYKFVLDGAIANILNEALGDEESKPEEEPKPKKKKKPSVRIQGKAISKKKLVELFGG